MGGPASKETWENYTKSEGEQGNTQPAKPAETKADTQNLNEVVPDKKEDDTVPMNETGVTNG